MLGLCWVRLQANLKTQLFALRRLVAGSVSLEPKKHVVDLNHCYSLALYNWTSVLGAILTRQLGNVLACLRELVQRVAGPQRDECVQFGIVGVEVRVGDSRDVVGVDGLGLDLELLNRFDGIIFRDCGGRFGGRG